MSVGTLQMRFYPLYLKSYEKFTFSMSAILDCKFRPSLEKSRVGHDRFEISIQKNYPISHSPCFFH